MKRFLFSIFFLGGLSFALAALPVRGQEKRQQSEILINRAPLRDFAKTVRQLDETERVDWTKPFSIEVEGVLTRDGKLTQARIIKTDGDKKLVEIAQEGIAAIADSGWLGYLRIQGVEKAKINIAQTSENFSFTVVSELPTTARANTVAAGLNSLVNGVLLLDKNGMRKLGDDERTLFSNTKVTAGEKTANIIFVMQAEEFREMILRRLNEPKEKTNG